ncbi:MAG: class I SAM-dependent methyltransferase [Bellilinea sp.]
MEFFQTIADRIIADLQPKTVLDAGCAKGFLVEGFRNRGVEAWGVDISEYAIQQIHESIKPYCRVGSITDSFPQKYDLIVTIEVVEHMTAEMGKKAIANLCAHADRILFSSTPFDFKETTHFNVQPPEYWSREFARHGFFRDVDFDASFITSWAVFYQKSNRPAHLLAYDYERRFWLLWKENTDLRELNKELRDQLRDKKQVDEIIKADIVSIQNLLDANSEGDSHPLNPALGPSSTLANAFQQLKDSISQFLHDKETVSGQTEEYKKRWEALEKTRTWKILSTFSKLKTRIFK